MLETLVSVINFIRTTFHYVLYISLNTGSFLVNSIKTLIKYMGMFINDCTIFYLVLRESLVNFTQDIAQFMQQTFLLVTTAIETIYSSVATIFLKVSLFISSAFGLIYSIYNAIGNGIGAIYASLGQTGIFLKNIAILIGSGVWFLTTLVPFFLYYLCTLSISIVYNIFQEICDICSSGVSNVAMLIKDIVVFILDVPVESIAGLIVALSLAYTFKQYYVVVVPYCKRQLLQLRNWINADWNVTEMCWRYFRSHSRQQTVTMQVPVQAPRRPTPRRRCSTPDDRYCVICQERKKCILLLPCKHLCLCMECTNELKYYNEVCPICRTDIERTMKIFV